MIEYPIQKLHEVYRNNGFYLKDTLFLDSFFATYFTKNSNTPLWLHPTAESGSGKSFLLKPFFNLVRADQLESGFKTYNTIIIDQLTATAFGSGSENVADLGMPMQKLSQENCGIFLYVPDTASLYYGSQDQTPIYAMFKTLFDGYYSRLTGKEKKTYSFKNVNFFGCSTHSTKYEWTNVLGTRDIKFNVDLIADDTFPYTTPGPDKIQTVSLEIAKFIDANKDKFSEHNILVETTPLAKYYALKMIPFRAQALYEKETGYFLESVSKEKPMRLANQLGMLLKGYMFLGLQHQECIDHLQQLLFTIGDPTRRIIYEEIKKQHKQEVSTMETLQRRLHFSKRILNYHTLVLADFGLLDIKGDTFTAVEEKEKEPDFFGVDETSNKSSMIPEPPE
jgi:hypothetical protein